MQAPGPVQASQLASHAAHTVSLLPAQTPMTYLPTPQFAQVPQTVSLVPPQAATRYLPGGQFEHVAQWVSAVAAQAAFWY